MLPLVREDYARWCKREDITTDEDKARLWRAFWAGWNAARERVDVAFKVGYSPVSREGEND